MIPEEGESFFGFHLMDQFQQCLRKKIWSYNLDVVVPKNKFDKHDDTIIMVISQVQRPITEGAWLIPANILAAFRSL